ncbi:uncharacterized protein LOC127842367 [Dreissena polymorpha]|uniref:Uncharacterized protein n=1 Tax=Dreissena polymorpha TaxID=45954 RepID=A0A9D4EFU2_DREPO|nr:uncharacterized protein LOC127842367 [Dreissena polymorpha]XP_052227792.1 uncharacterized protein LOC127842367 [Dreissena polymorpha]KAH3779844.1 hypothetical protein DPMN_157652 [Dreissena polymorpha]
MSPTTVADSTKDVDARKLAQRKTNKPLIEKRRRARINDCLTQLKTIVLGSSEQQAGRTSKLEKADILEMTVEFVKSRLNKTTGSMVPNSLQSSDTSIKCDATYVAGYSECLSEISRFLEQTLSNNTTLKEKLERHICDKLNSNSVTNLSDAHSKSNNEVCHTSQEHSVSSDCDEVNDFRTNGSHVSNEKNTEELIGSNGLPTHTKTTDQQVTATGQDWQYGQPLGWLYGNQVVLIPLPSPFFEHIKQHQTFRQILPLSNNACFPGNSQRMSTFPTQSTLSPTIVCSERANEVLAFSTPNAQHQDMNNLDLTQCVAVCSTPNGPSDRTSTPPLAQGFVCSTIAPVCLTLQPHTAHTICADTIPYWRPW